MHGANMTTDTLGELHRVPPRHAIVAWDTLDEMQDKIDALGSRVFLLERTLLVSAENFLHYEDAWETEPDQYRYWKHELRTAIAKARGDSC